MEFTMHLAVGETAYSRSSANNTRPAGNLFPQSAVRCHYQVSLLPTPVPHTPFHTVWGTKLLLLGRTSTFGVATDSNETAGEVVTGKMTLR